MGFYINKIGDDFVPPRGKVQFILDHVPGAKIIAQPDRFREDLVCVVDNGNFEGAGFCFDRQEMIAFLPTRSDRRPRTWMVVPDAAKLSGYKERLYDE